MKSFWFLNIFWMHVLFIVLDFLRIQYTNGIRYSFPRDKRRLTVILCVNRKYKTKEDSSKVVLWYRPYKSVEMVEDERKNWSDLLIGTVRLLRYDGLGLRVIIKTVRVAWATTETWLLQNRDLFLPNGIWRVWIV